MFRCFLIPVLLLKPLARAPKSQRKKAAQSHSMQAAMDTDPCKCFADRAVRPCLQRWGLADELKAVRVRFERKSKDEELIRGILTDEVRTALGLPVAEDDAAVRVERLKCEATTLALFDPLGACQDVTLGSGRAKQCPQVVIGGVECDNALRKWLARKKYDRDVAAGARDGEEEDDDEERPTVALEDDELLYRLFELLALGGPLAQPDLELDHYLKATKALYRDCVQVYKRSSDGATCLANEAYEVAGPLVFGNGDPRPLARCLIITEPKRAKALVVFSPARGMW